MLLRHPIWYGRVEVSFIKPKSFGQLGALKNKDILKRSGVPGDKIVMKRNFMKQIVSKKPVFRDDRMRTDKITERRQCMVKVRPCSQLNVMVQETKKMEEEQ